MIVVQILAILVFLALITLVVLAFIEPGPLTRRSRDRQGQPPARQAPSQDQDQVDPMP